MAGIDEQGFHLSFRTQRSQHPRIQCDSRLGDREEFEPSDAIPLFIDVSYAHSAPLFMLVDLVSSKEKGISPMDMSLENVSAYLPGESCRE